MHTSLTWLSGRASMVSFVARSPYKILQGLNMHLLGIVAQHGYAAVAIVIFFASLGIPLPVGLTMLAAGAAAHSGLRLESVFAIAFCSALTGDLLLFLGGRYTGWWLLSGICRLSLNPERCIFSSADAFYRRGSRTLLFAKFIPGLGTVAAPIAGSLHMRLNKFLRFMAIGDALYCTAWITAGYTFYKFIQVIANAMDRAGHAVLLGLILLVSGYCATLLFFTLRARRYRKIERISAQALCERMNVPSSDRLVIIADVRSHNYYDPGMQRIKNSIRVEPNRLHEELLALKEFMVPECEIYLYCSCIRDTTSARVAHALQLANCRTTVIQGGIKAWKIAGGSLEKVPESEVQHLPRFD